MTYSVKAIAIGLLIAGTAHADHDLFGGKNRASEVLSEKRPLTLP